MTKCKNCRKEVKINSDEEFFCSKECAEEYYGRTIQEGLSW